MKKNRAMRFASVILILTLLSTSVISGTFAQYVTTNSGSDTARVAKFGVTIEVKDDEGNVAADSDLKLFATSYATEDTKYEGALSVESSNLYVHPGYKIVGWNTDPKATSTTETGWYDAGAVYTFLNQADASLEDTTDGITYRMDGDDTGLNLYTELEKDYYLYTEDGKFDIDRSDKDDPILVINPVATGDAAKGHFVITCPSDLTEETTVTLTLGLAKKLPTIDTQVEEKQVFGTVTGDSAVISRDSAFTVCFTLENYDTEDYLQPVLQFTPGFPQGTTIILLDKVEGTYWACNNASGATVSLDRFIRMGTASTPYKAESGDRKLQFIVDFPDDASLPVGDGRITLHVAKKQGIPENVPNLTLTENGNLSYADVTAKSTLFGLTREDSGGGLEATLQYSFGGGAAASRLIMMKINK